MKLILILRSKDKQTADSPCEEIPISGEIENEAKAYKAFRTQKCKAFRSRSVPFRSQNVSFRSKSVSFRPRSVPFRANRSAFPWCSSTLQGLYIIFVLVFHHIHFTTLNIFSYHCLHWLKVSKSITKHLIFFLFTSQQNGRRCRSVR